MAIKEHETKSAVPCCPEIEAEQACDVIDFHYRTLQNALVTAGNQRQNVLVEVIMKARFERCPGPMVLGDLVYSNTLLPGEKVRLFTADRRSSFTFDAESKVSYRHQHTSEEQYYMSSMSNFLSDLSISDSGSASSRTNSTVTGHASASGAIQSFFAGPSVSARGTYSAESTSDFLRQLRSHARSSHFRSESATRTLNSVSVGEVQSRSHAEGESEDHFESSSREFANPNKCHAITFYFYQINKKQRIRFTIEEIERRVIDPAADTRVTNNAFLPVGDVAAIPNGVLATAKDRIEVEANARRAAAAVAQESASANLSARFAGFSSADVLRGNVGFPAVEPLSPAVRQRALQVVDEKLVANGLLDRIGGRISEEAQRSFSFEVEASLPTAGVLVRGCLDDCDICEPEVKRDIELDLERKKLENELLKRKIDLLDKAQEYRCCPKDEEESAPEHE